MSFIILFRHYNVIERFPKGIRDVVDLYWLSYPRNYGLMLTLNNRLLISYLCILIILGVDRSLRFSVLFYYTVT